MAKRGKNKGEAASKAATATAEPAKEEKPTIPIPAFHDENGLLAELSKKDFPKSQEGKLAYCDYQIAKWSHEKELITKAKSPTGKKLMKLERLKRQFAKLKAELEADESDEAQEGLADVGE